ncbi:hypothetical protein OHV05_26080 [Kitasatospora sp. NBC_00070]|uniref:hypothetical protein n=1 Tax=Kitasatospora sp. NBC_00070 TaxID=2975962 RepID=UPI003251BFB1
MKFRTAAAAVLALTLLTSCGTTAGSTKDTSLRIATEDQIGNELKQVSAKVQEAFAVKGRTGQSEALNFSDCEDKDADKGARDAIHFWQIDDLAPADLDPAVSRLYKYFEVNGWIGLGQERTADKADLKVWAKNPEKTVAVFAQSFHPMNRIIVQVSSSCFKIPTG